MLPLPETLAIESEPSRLSVIQNKPFFRIIKYIFWRVFAISLTIVIGVFITVVIANRGGMLDKILRTQIDRQISYLEYVGNSTEDIEAQRLEMEAAQGLSLSFWPKHLLYTSKALRLDWGNVLDQRKFNTWIQTSTGAQNIIDSRAVIFSKFPATLLLTGTAYLLMALVGIPLALYLSQREGHWLDRMVGIFTPLSSVPSWVIGILLVAVFAAGLKLLPAGKMFDTVPPDTTWETITVVARHMVLPVTAIVLSLIFQLVYNWRTYLLIYSNEDYVTLAKAKGLKRNILDFHYILRPALPYMVTNLALTLVGFWQMITALEYFFQWPGIGKMFVDALPNFRGENMYSGEMSIVVGIVVLFAYILGATVFLLDFVYLLVDPRLRAESRGQTVSLPLKHEHTAWSEKLKDLFSRPIPPVRQARKIDRNQRPTFRPGPAFESLKGGLKQTFSGLTAVLRRALREIYRVPTAAVGLVLAVLLVIISILVVIFIPYDPIGKLWSESNLTGNPTVAKLALPKWVNWFRRDPLPPTIILTSQNNPAVKQINRDIPESPRVQIDFSFDYPYHDFPSDMVIYLSSQFVQKKPFIFVSWITPDGREIQLKGVGVTNPYTYSMKENVLDLRKVSANEHWKKWFVSSGFEKTPEYYVLFADPNADEPAVLPGKYTLRIKSVLFEKDSDIEAQFVAFGLVEGWAGTDYLRRDLIVPLLWGLPFALLVGVIGAVATSILSLILAAASAWLGGWVDAVVQRANEANLILPVVAIGVLLYSYYNLSIFLILAIIILSNVLGSSTKVFRAAFLQEKEAGYIEAARAYGASDWRIITRYLVPRILPAIIPQIVMLIPNFIFLEATLAIFNIFDARYPTWGRILYSALRNGALYGNQYWVLEPIALMLLTGLAFVLISFALNRMLAPHLQSK